MNNKTQPHNFTDPVGQDWVRGLLQDNNVEDLSITFTKKDGTERKMFCTLSEDKIPFDKKPQVTTVRPVSTEAQRVFDLEVGDWRSFRWDSIKTVEFSLGE